MFPSIVKFHQNYTDLFAGVLTLSDECDYWNYVAHSTESQKEKLQAKRVLQILKPLGSK